jgi:hypothetical protein
MALINCPECHRAISDKAGACPNCGFPLEKIESIGHPIATDYPELNNRVCPYCNSENTISIKDICLAGASSGSSNGFDASSSINVEAGIMNSCSPDELAKKYSPVKPPGSIFKRIGAVCLIVALILAFTGSGIGSALALIAMLLGVVSMMIGKKDPRQKEWDAKINFYENGWICRKCGSSWIPSEINENYDRDEVTRKSGSLIWNSEDETFIRVQCPYCNKDGRIYKETVKRTYSSGYSLNVDCMCRCGFTSDRIKFNKNRNIKPESTHTADKIRIISVEYEDRGRCLICGKVQRLILELETRDSKSFKCLSCMKWHTRAREKRDIH